jgi:hypothetical protein
MKTEKQQKKLVIKRTHLEDKIIFKERLPQKQTIKIQDFPSILNSLQK